MQRIVYTPAEVQSMLGIKRQTVYDLLHSGEIPAIRIGRNYKIPKDMFDAWMAEAAERGKHEEQEKGLPKCE